MTTTLVAIRHAEPESEGYASDALRPLTKQGRAMQRQMTELLKSEGIQPDIIYTSPLLRARETAEIISEIFGVAYEEEPALNEFNAEILLEKLPLAEKNQTIFFVGHAPTLGEFVNQLVGKMVLPDGLPKSGAAVVKFQKECALGKGHFVTCYRP